MVKRKAESEHYTTNCFAADDDASLSTVILRRTIRYDRVHGEGW